MAMPNDAAGFAPFSDDKKQGRAGDTDAPLDQIKISDDESMLIEPKLKSDYGCYRVLVQ